MQITVLDQQAAAPVGTAELVARARNGDRVAWDGLVDRYGGMVWAVARAQGLDARDAGDTSQVTWLLLTQHLTFLRQPERLEAWLAMDRHPRGVPHAPAARLRATRRVAV